MVVAQGIDATLQMVDIMDKGDKMIVKNIYGRVGCL